MEKILNSDFLQESEKKLDQNGEDKVRAGKMRVFAALQHARVDEALEAKEKYGLSEDDVRGVALEGIIQALGTYDWESMNIDAALEIKKKFNLSEDDVMFAVKDGLIGRFAKIKEKDFDNVDGVKEKFNLSDDFFKTAIKEGFFSALERNSPFMAVKIKERFNLSDDFIKSDKVISAVAQKAQYRMYHDIDDAILLKEKFSLPEDISIDVAKNGMVNMLTDQRTVVEIDWHRSDAISKAMEIKEKFGLSKEASDSSVKTAMINSFRHHGDGITFAVEMKDAFNLSDEIVQEAVKEGIVDSFLSGGVVYGIGLGEKFNLPENMVRDIAKSVMLGKMDEEEGDNWECIRELREKFNLYKEYDDEIKIQKDK